MERRQVTRIVPAVRTVEGGGFGVRRPFPTQALSDFDPFLLLDEMGPADHGPGEAVGAPDHPHRGFETVTYLLAGSFEHRDSAGHHGVLAPGDVQWMTAGDGVIHSELPSKELLEKGGRLHGFQLWVNLPRKDKRMPPRYQDLPSARLPVVEQGGVRAKVVAGSLLGVSAVIDTRTPILYAHLSAKPGARATLELPADHRVMAYVFAGAAELSGRRVAGGALALLGDGAGARALAAGEAGAELLLLGGVPLREPIARYGPFVMSTRQELHEAVDDFRSGRFGKIAAR